MEEIEKKVGKLKKAVSRLANNENFLIGIIIILIVLVVLLSLKPGLINFLKSDGKYNIELIKIEGCEECFDLNLISKSLNQENANIKESSLEYKSDDARKLMGKYSVRTVPSIILKGKVDKLELDTSIFRIGKNFAVFEKSVPYIDETGILHGVVNATEIYDSGCLECFSFSRVKEQLVNAGVRFQSYELVEINSEKGKNLMGKNNISFAPTMLISKEIEDYWWIFPNINSLFERKEQYILKSPIAPYKELSSGLIRGRVRITYITNKSCSDCYNATLLKDLFAGIGIYIDKEKYVDISTDEGRRLISSYNIGAVPTAILSREILDYNLKSILERVGNFTNNEFVLIKLDSLNLKYQKIK